MKSLFLFLFVATAGRAVKIDSQVFNNLRQEANGLIGVASIAGITSRNGRVSSVRGVKFFPGSGPDIEYLYPLEYSDEKINSYPFTVTSQRDGKFVAGTVQASPGYISASASSGFGSPTESRVEYNPPNFGQQRSLNGFFYPSRPELFGPRHLQSWLPKDFFQGYLPSAPDVRNGWLINNFNPFMNFWR